MSPEPDPQNRIEVFRNMLESDPENELANYTLGKLYLESGDLESSEKLLRKTLQLNPMHSMSYRLLGQLLLDRDRRDEGVALLEKGVGIAHEKGEYQPRNQMQELLRSIGVEPPEPVEKAGGTAETAAEGAWVCRRCGKGNEQLEKSPLPGEIGQLIHEGICQPCWREWIAMSIKVINECRLNLATEEGNQTYETHLREFLGL